MTTQEAQGPRFAVQRPKGKRWETLHVDRNPVAAVQAFRQVVQQFPKSYVRIIQIEFESADDTAEYRWRLLQLYDPKTAPKTADAPPSDPPRRGAAAPTRAPAEKLRIPVVRYLLALAVGLIGGAILYLRWHQSP